MLKIEDYSCDKYAEVRSCSEGLIAVSDGKFWGFVDGYSNQIIPCQYK